MNADREIPWASVTRILCAVVAVVAYARLYLGVDVTDESFYNVLPHSFALGLRPYRDELNITQNAGILLTPIYWLYHVIVGSTTGLVLFNRHLYFLLVLACSTLGFRVGALSVDRNVGRVLAIFVLTFSYFNIPSLSYNTLGALTLFSALFLLLGAALENNSVRATRAIFAANLCFILSAFSHPAFLPGAVTGIGASLWWSWRAPATRNAWLISAGIGAVAALVFFSFFGRDVGAVLAYARSYAYDLGAARLTQVLGAQARSFAPLLVAIGIVVALPFLPIERPPLRRAWPWIALIVASAILFFVHQRPSVARLPAASAITFLSLGVSLPLVLLFLPERPRARTMTWLVVVPCFVGAAGLSVSSTNGLLAAMLALFPAAICCLLGLASLAQTRGQLTPFLVVLLSLVVFQSVALLERSYRDAPFSAGPPVFASGPFAGLLTTEANAQAIAMLRSDLQSLEREARTLFVYDRYPAAYLLSNLRPRTFSTWVFWPSDPVAARPLLERIFGRDAAPPDVVLQINPSTDLVDPELRRLDYVARVTRPALGYTIWVRHDHETGKSTNVSQPVEKKT